MAVKGKGFDAPLDPVEDFNNKTTLPGSPAEDQIGHLDEEIAEFTDTVAMTAEERAARREELESESQPEQLELEGSQPEEPKMIRNGKMLAEFVRPHFEKEESGERFIGFEFSFALTPEHGEDGHLPSEVLEEWEHMRSGTGTRTQFEIVGQQTIAVGLVPDDEQSDLILVAASITHPALAKVQEKGSGKTTKIIRFSFRAVVNQREAIARFAVDHHGDTVWINMQRTQGNLYEQQ